ncbi:hypothetical protein DRO26_02590 [Candidatus Bathyarchaeota archaeon]|nr:MAG: hypothetical protein DRO26_02590 [Candidatus Bathyarchaeota archaeon]
MVEEARIEFGTPVFLLRLVGSPKKSFENLVRKMKPYNLIPFLRKRNGNFVLFVVQKPKTKPPRVRINLILFVVTTITIFVSGYINSITWTSIFGGNPFIHAVYFTLALLAIVGLHEVGHQVVCRLRGIEATLPYFIPGPPFPIGFGTFGAVIMQKEPPVNRDELFDLGFSGPLVGFLVTLLVTIITIQTVQPVDPTFLAKKGVSMITLPVTLAWTLLIQLIKPVPSGLVLLIPPIGWAAWLGFVITFLNLLPIWQLDGGHLAAAMFGRRGHTIASMIGLLITFVTGFWFFGLLLLFLATQSKRAEILDEVSPISNHKKILGVLSYVILVLSAVIFWP